MAPRQQEDPVTRNSPLTNSKLLFAFKKVNNNKIKIEDVTKLGEKYLKKETSIR